ncbi:MAG: glutathione S-transferase family protein [Lautropia sp.]|nr:glutathione S-transferase family protein [Lautropia sp.]
MSQYTLYTHPRSRGMMVHWMLEECAADYSIVPLAYGADMKSAEYLAINPMGKVPALKVDDQILTETAAICLWLAERFPEKKLIPPAGSLARGQIYRWQMLLVHLEYAAFDRLWQIAETPERQRSLGYGSFDTLLNLLRSHLSKHDYLVGDRFSVLDMYCAGLLMQFMQSQPVIPSDDPVLLPYMQRFLGMPSFARVQEQTPALQEQLEPRTK